jgi:TupA-like ATPgrasp
MIDIVIGGLRFAKRRTVGGAMGYLEEMRRRIMRRSEGEAALFRRFAEEHGYALDVANPRTFSEKVYCRMIRWNRRIEPRFTELADKFAVRPYVAGKVGEEYLARILWHGTDPRQIPFDRLSAPYVLKTNHGCGHVVAVTGAPDRDEIRRRASHWVAANYYWAFREYQYFRIPPRLMAEEYLENPDGSEAVVYKFWCFDGAPQVLHVTDRANSMNPFFDMDWRQLQLSHKGSRAQPALPRPKNFERMVTVASHLSADFDFVRVDLFNVGGRTYFNELTFTPAAGKLHFSPPDWDEKLGRLWTLRD